MIAFCKDSDKFHLEQRHTRRCATSISMKNAMLKPTLAPQEDSMGSVNRWY